VLPELFSRLPEALSISFAEITRELPSLSRSIVAAFIFSFPASLPNENRLGVRVAARHTLQLCPPSHRRTAIPGAARPRHIAGIHPVALPLLYPAGNRPAALPLASPAVVRYVRPTNSSPPTEIQPTDFLSSPAGKTPFPYIFSLID
jgi:hypothetical protein